MFHRVVTSVLPAVQNVSLIKSPKAVKFFRAKLPQANRRYSTNSNVIKETPETGKVRTFQPFPVNGRPMQVTVAQPQDAEECYDFLLRHFFPVAPLRQIHRWDESEANRNPTWKLEQTREYLKQPYSTIARDPDSGNRIVSFVMNKVIQRPLQPVKIVIEEQAKDRSPGWIARSLISQLNKDLDLFALCNTDRIFYISTWVADPKIARSGLSFYMGTSMMNAVDQEEGVGVTVAETFSKFTQNAMAKYGFKILRELKYDDFEIDGQKPLAGLPELAGNDTASIGVWLSKCHRNATNVQI